MTLGLTFGVGQGIYSNPVFSPPDLPDIFLWLDASDLSTIVQTGGNVSQWGDKSGHAYHATQGSAALQPVSGSHSFNGLNVLAFDGVGEFLYLPSGAFSITTGDSTVFMVVATNLIATHQYPLFARVGGSSLYGVTISHLGNQGAGFKCGSGNQTSLYTSTGMGPNIIGGYRSGSTNATFVNAAVGTTAGTANNFTPDNLTIGRSMAVGSGHLNGAIGEIILYKRFLSIAERAKVISYLKQKWNTP